MTKTAHMIDVYGAFTGSRDWPLDPLETAKVVGIPIYRRNPNYIEEPPPETAEGEIAVWDREEERWHVAPDHRGETWLSQAGEPVKIEFPGDPAALGFVKPGEPQPSPITEAEQAIIALAVSAAVDASLDQLLASGAITPEAHAAVRPSKETPS